MVQVKTQPAPVAWIDRGVDYLTCTYGPRAKLTRLRLSIARCEAQETSFGNITKQWGMSGYLGYRCGGLEYGWRGDGVIVRLSGPTAQTWWRRFGRLATNASRIDLQETVLWDEPIPTTLSRHWKEMRAWSNSRRNAPALKLISGEDGPETIYSGKRASDIYLRAYNRFAKTKDQRFLGHLRYEVEFKSHRARFVLGQMLRSKDADNECTSQCLTMFRNRGCGLPEPEYRPASLRSQIRSNDVDKRLTWLRNQVQCTVQELRALGYEREVLEALGFLDRKTWTTWSNN